MKLIVVLRDLEFARGVVREMGFYVIKRADGTSEGTSEVYILKLTDFHRIYTSGLSLPHLACKNG